MRPGAGLLAGILLAVAASCLPAAARAQSGGEVGPPDTFSVSGPVGGATRHSGRLMTDQQMKAQSVERQKQIVADTEKLLALALEVKADLQKTGQGTTPPPELAKKLEEMERLAHEVKTREVD